jgi:hypothetical protein
VSVGPVVVMMTTALVAILAVLMLMGGRIVVVEPALVLMLMHVLGIPVTVGMRMAQDGHVAQSRPSIDVKPWLPYRASVHRTRRSG